MELGPKGTGKSHVFQELSPYGVLVSGGDVTSPRLFVSMAGKKENIGLVGYWDVVAWDEFEQQKGRNVDAVLIDTMQNYLANKSFNRGKGTHEASASMVFVGNTKHTVPYMLKNSHLFESIPTAFIKGAFLDRIHLYNPGWEIHTLKKNSFSTGYGLITDYIAAALHNLRNLDWTDKLKDYAKFDGSLSERDHLAIRKTFSGMMKLLYPDGIVTGEEAYELVDFAAESRKRVKDQLYILDETFKSDPAKFIYTKAKGGEEIKVETLECINYGVEEDTQPKAETAPETPAEAYESHDESSTGKPAKSKRPRIGDTRQKTISFRSGQIGVTFERLFGPYLANAKEIHIEDPYLRNAKQLRNLIELITMLIETRSVEGLKISLDTWEEDEEKCAELIDRLNDIQDDLTGYGIEFTYKLRDFHDRAITTDDGWRIVLGRGLDIYDKYSAFSVASGRPDKRRVKEFSIDYMKV